MAQSYNPPTFNAGEPLSVDKLNQMVTSLTNTYQIASDLQNQTKNTTAKYSASSAPFSSLTNANIQTITLEPTNFEGIAGRYVFSVKTATPLDKGTFITVTQISDTQATLTTNSSKTIAGEVNYIGFFVV